MVAPWGALGCGGARGLHGCAHRSPLFASVGAPLEQDPKKRGLRSPWKPGQSGNPAGRPKNVLREALHKRVGIDKLSAIIERALVDGDSRIIAAIIDREWPKPPAAVELSGPDGGPVNLNAGAREKLIEKLKRRDGAT